MGEGTEGQGSVLACWKSSVKVFETPVGKYAAVLRRVREKRRALLQRDDEFPSTRADFVLFKPSLMPSKVSNPRNIYSNNIWR